MRLSLWVLVCLVCQACHGQDLKLADPRPGYAASGNLPLWEVSADRGKVYLLGSVHVQKADVYPLAEPIEAAFEAADVTVFEVDLKQASSYEASLLMQTRGVYTAPRSIDTELSAETLVLLGQYAQENGLQIEQFQRLRPWMISLQIGLLELAKLGYKPNFGVDIHYQNRARDAQKPVVALESFEQQVEMLAGDPPEVQEMALAVALRERAEMSGMIQSLISAWRGGDAERMYAISTRNAYKHPALEAQMEVLLDHRNLRMAEQIEVFLATDKVYFVVIGALHMGGENGLLKLLGKHYRVRQVTEKRS